MSEVNNSIDLDLVGVIYDTALDPDFWPAMLQGLVKEVDTKHLAENENITSLPTRPELIKHVSEDVEEQLMTRLMPHFKRAFEINSRILDLEHDNQVQQSIINQIPLGILVVNGEGKIIFRNQNANKILQSKEGLLEEGGYIKCHNNMASAHLFATLQTIIHQTTKDGWAKNRSISVKSAVGEPVQSLFLTSNSIFQLEQSWERRYVTILVAAPGSCLDINVEAIQSFFGLTPATAKLAKALAAGKTIEEYASHNELSINTVRAQLKALFASTNTNSQSKLVRKILTSPVIYQNKSTQLELDNSERHINISESNESIKEGVFNLEDGRTISYAEYGDPDGFPVFFLHGTYGSRYFRHPDPQITIDSRVRLICPDRPGFGGSSVKRKRTLLCFSEDIKQLADHLACKKFSIVGHDAGGCYALACAHQMPERLKAVLVCNSYADYQSISEFNDSVPNEKLFYSLARFLPTLFERYAQLQLSKLTQDFTWYYKKITRYLPDCDREIILDPRVISMFYQTSLEGLKDAYGFAKDMVLVSKDWGFNLRDVSPLVHVWHGLENRHIPPSMGRRLANSIPRTKTRFVPNSGHFLTLSHWEEILVTVNPKANKLTHSA